MSHDTSTDDETLFGDDFAVDGDEPTDAVEGSGQVAARLPADPVT
jgi:hypothetical protein